MKTNQSKLDAGKSLKNGVSKEFYKDGALSCVGKYRDGEKVGVWKHYLVNGQLRAVGKFAGGKMSSPWKWYRENGKLMQTGSFVDEKGCVHFDLRWRAKKLGREGAAFCGMGDVSPQRFHR